MELKYVRVLITDVNHPILMLFSLSLAFVSDLTYTFDRVQAHNKDILVLYKSIWSLQANQFTDAYEDIEKELATRTFRISSIFCDENPAIC